MLYLIFNAIAPFRHQAVTSKSQDIKSNDSFHVSYKAQQSDFYWAPDQQGRLSSIIQNKQKGERKRQVKIIVGAGGN